MMPPKKKILLDPHKKKKTLLIILKGTQDKSPLDSDANRSTITES